MLAPADEMFFARFQCGMMQAGLTPVKSDKLKDCKNIHHQAMRVRVSFAYSFQIKQNSSIVNYAPYDLIIKIDYCHTNLIGVIQSDNVH